MNLPASLNQSPPNTTIGFPLSKFSPKDNRVYTTNYQNNNNHYPVQKRDQQLHHSLSASAKNGSSAKNIQFPSSHSIELHAQQRDTQLLDPYNGGPTPLTKHVTLIDCILGPDDDQTISNKGVIRQEAKKAQFIIGGSTDLKGSNGLKKTKDLQGPLLAKSETQPIVVSPPRYFLTEGEGDEFQNETTNSRNKNTSGLPKSTITIPTMTIGKPTTMISPSSPSSSTLTSVTIKNDLNHHSQSTRHQPSPVLCKSREENFECLADGSESFFDSANESSFTSLQNLRENELSGFSGHSLPFRRNSILRTSLRKSPQNSNGETMGGHRRVGSFRNPSGTKRSPVVPPVSSSSALAATQLYRSSSFHSSGRSSAGDVEEMYSDGSIEDEVIDLTQKYHHLEEKFTVLAENQSNVDDRYTRSKQENIELSTKLFMLEEQMRDAEQRADERLREEQRRSKESITRLEREKELQIANYEIRLQSSQKDLDLAKVEGIRLKGQLDKERSEQNHFSDKLIETERELSNLRDENRKLMDEARTDRDALTLETIGSQQALIDLKREFENLRKYQMSKSQNPVQHRESIDDLGELHSRLMELDEENKKLKNKNRNLQESNDDFAAQILNHSLEEGRHLLTMNHMGGIGNSLAEEFEAMSQDQQTAAQGYSTIQESNGRELDEMKSALKEQKDVNDQLKAYIDNILLAIVENYPQLLEVKNKCPLSQNLEP